LKRSLAEFEPNTGNRNERLVTEFGGRYHPRFDFSGPFCAQSGVRVGHWPAA
jgi:hypothetical protein